MNLNRLKVIGFNPTLPSQNSSLILRGMVLFCVTGFCHVAALDTTPTPSVNEAFNRDNIGILLWVTSGITIIWAAFCVGRTAGHYCVRFNERNREAQPPNRMPSFIEIGSDIDQPVVLTVDLVHLNPIMPTMAKKVWNELGVPDNILHIFPSGLEDNTPNRLLNFFNLMSLNDSYINHTRLSKLIQESGGEESFFLESWLNVDELLVQVSNGNTYAISSIRAWLEMGHTKDPLTNCDLTVCMRIRSMPASWDSRLKPDFTMILLVAIAKKAIKQRRMDTKWLRELIDIQTLTPQQNRLFECMVSV